MNKWWLSIFLSVFLNGVSIGQAGQFLKEGFTFQGIARDNSGGILSEKPLQFILTFSTKTGMEERFFSEAHQILTDELGLFTLHIGSGHSVFGNVSSIPWSTKQIWVDIEISDPQTGGFIAKLSQEVLAVPYAYHARTASNTLDTFQIIEKNKSIRWTTSGNSATQPGVHYVGTADEQDLVIKSNNAVNAIITNNGQVQIHGRVEGENEVEANYPLKLEGGNQGIYIEVNGARNGNTHFVTFAEEGGMSGRIEGQTRSELTNSSEWKWVNESIALRATQLALEGAALATEVAALYTAASLAAVSIILVFKSFPYAGAAIALSANIAALGVDIEALRKESEVWRSNKLNRVGVTYESGAGDYAEWLEREQTERDLVFGEIVGVKAGKISLKTGGADHVLVVSQKPIVLGNLPSSGKTDQFEKVAFLGQVYVRVLGTVSVGDYILPSGNNDGLGIAVNPTQLPIRDYPKIVGTAWEASTDSPVSLVKVCVGQSSDVLAPVVEDIENKLDKIRGYLGETPVKASLDTSIQKAEHSPLQMAEQDNGVRSDAAFDSIIESKAVFLRQYYGEIQSNLARQGIEVPEGSYLYRVFRDPVQHLKSMRRMFKGSEYAKKLDALLLKEQ